MICSIAWGFPFNRTSEGLLDFRRFGGTLYHRTAFCRRHHGASSLLYALDEQVRRFESEKKVTKYEGWEFLSIIKDSGGVCRGRGICAMDLRSMEVRTFAADAGDSGHRRQRRDFWQEHELCGVYRFRAGGGVSTRAAVYANGEFIQGASDGNSW